jgi:23S rRNA-/tRNA-specific pseudouridylate synthase
MAIKRVKFIATSAHASRRLDDALAEWLPRAVGRPVSKSKGRKLIMAGAVHVNGKPVRIASKALVPGTTIEAHIDLAKLFEDSTSRDQRFELTPDRILFEDEDLIVIDKPPGLPAQPTVDQGRDNLFSAVRRFLSKRNAMGEPYLGVHHRLDRDTSGAVLFTKSQRANAGVAELFSTHRVVKTYQALTGIRGTFRVSDPLPPRFAPGGSPPLEGENASIASAGGRSHEASLERQWTIRNYLAKVSSKGKRARYGAVDTDGAFAETAFRLIAEYPRGLWIEAVPKTGRTHQIRVHLSECGLPILGDDLYGLYGEDESLPSGLASRLMLHAARLTFPHPITKHEILVKCPQPEDFRQCLRRMKTR